MPETPGSATGEAGPSEFKCLHANCGKTFTRKDHLVRHSANHSSNNFYCAVCNRPFKRLDLLQRHEKRNICGDDGYTRKRARSSSSADDSPRRGDPPADPATLGAAKTDEQSTWNGYNWPAAEWESLWHDMFASPFDASPEMNIFNPPRVQQSAERGATPTVPILGRLQEAFPNLDLSYEFVTEGMNRYWADIAPSFPFIHRATLDLEHVAPELIMMMVITGNKVPSYSTTVSSIRGQLVQQCGFDMPLSTLQAYTLCHVYDTWYGSKETQFVAQCMWPVMVAHARKTGIGVVGRPEHDMLEEEAWTLWAKDEERRRAAFCVLLMDTQLSAFWNQHCSRQLSIFAHNLNLPSSRSQWDAMTASEWMRYREVAPLRRKSSKTGFMPGLHPEFQVSSISEGYSTAVVAALACQPPVPLVVDLEHYLGVEMVLMGLMAAAWDCRTKGNMGIRFKEGSRHWREMLLNAIIELRKAWETSAGHVPPCAETRDLRDSFALSIVSVLCDIPMLQSAAGATSVCGATIGPRQYTDAKRRLRVWYKSDDAFKCLWQCARYLRGAVLADWGIHSPWAVFVTTLVIWAYAWAASKEDRTEIAFPPTEDSRTATSLLLETLLAQSGRPQNLDTGIGDLLTVVAEKLDQREAISKEHAALLWKLCGKTS